MLGHFKHGPNPLANLNGVVDGVNSAAARALAAARIGREVGHLGHGFYARIGESGEADGTYKFAELYEDDAGAFQPVTESARGSEVGDIATEHNGVAADLEDLIVWIWETTDDSGAIQYRFALGGLPPYPSAEGVYWLKLEVDGGGVPTLSWGETTEDCPE